MAQEIRPLITKACNNGVAFLDDFQSFSAFVNNSVSFIALYFRHELQVTDRSRIGCRITKKHVFPI